MWQMTLKQRRRHGELIGELDRLKKDPHFKVPDGYVPGADEAEDAKYVAVLEKLNTILEQLHALETAARERV